MELGKAVYEAAAKSGGAAGAGEQGGTTTEGKPADDVIDAEYEVKE